MSKQGYRERCLAQKINACNVCGSSDKLVVHHINGDQEDNRLENLIPVCQGCHGKIHRKVNVSGRVKELKEKRPRSSLTYTSEATGESSRGRRRALLTDKERERIANQDADGNEAEYRYQAISRVRRKITEELSTDIELLKEHHPTLLKELQEEVCDMEEGIND